MIPRYALPILAAVAISGIYGCDSNDGTSQTTSPAPPATDPSAKEKILALENSGAIPKLERTPSVAGIDANSNGVRDDVEAFIEANYSTLAQRAAAQQLASVMQAAMMVDKANMAAVKATSLRSSRAVNCIYMKFDSTSATKQPFAVVEEIESISTNTKARVLAYLAYSKALDGTSSGLPDGDTCE